MPSRFWRGIRTTGFKALYFRGLLITGLVAGAFCFAVPCYAEKDIVKALEEKKAVQIETTKKAEALQSEVGGLQSKLVDTAKNVRDAEDALSDAEQKLKNLRAQKTTYMQNLAHEQDSLGGFVMAARKYKSTSTPQMLVQSSPIDAARASIVMKSIIPVLNKQSAYLKDELSSIDKVQTAIAQQLDSRAKELRIFKDQNDKLDVLLKERQALYKSTESERKKQEAEVEKLSKEAKNLNDLVEKIKPKKQEISAYRLPSGAILPVQGRVRTGFGETDDLGAKSQGITFTTRAEATVITPLSGTVKFAGPFQKYKQILIVEHQGGYHSLIAGLGRIDTVVGAVLSAGEPVGVAEKSQQDAQIYYELRQNGEPINPQKLTLAGRKQEKS